MRFPRTLATALLSSALAVACIKASAPPPAQTAASTAAPGAAGGEPLRAAAARAGRYIGTAFETQHLHDAAFRDTVAREFNSLTPENEMKWESIEPRPGGFAFAAGDALVRFAREHDMRVRGHTLVWHSQLAGWVKGLSGEALHAAMIRHVKEVAGHFKGQIAEWDVVNEAIADGSGGELRADSPFTALGPTFLDDAFRAAHEADPGAVLCYNDYEIEGEGTPKSDAAYALAKRLKDAGVPIGCVGLQMHVDPRHWPTVEQIHRNVERLAALGLRVELTEMDVPVGEIPGSREQKLEKQRALTREILGACLSVVQCTGVTFWGVTDRHSWLNDPHWGALRGTRPHLPLPFDSDYRPKPMVSAIRDAFDAAAK
jgi:endo-1,4-beta-xylanase